MTSKPKRLSPRSAAILKLIAAGHNYEQVLAAEPKLTYLDIFAAAREALEVAGEADNAAGAAAPTARPLHNVMEFYGRGSATWDGTDAQEYVNRLREEWDHRP